MEPNSQLRELLMLTIQEGASDLHLTEKSPAILRVDGRLVTIKKEILTRDQIKDMIFGILSEAQKETFEQDKELDLSLALTGLDRFRVNVHVQRGSVEAAFRRISSFIPSMDELQLPPIITDLARKQNGLVLVTGPTGTGKTTTLASMIDLINSERTCVIVCIEDPIEYLFVNKRSVVK
ncbi:MAG: Flp pilus assembly complex ATPase component TadA, partial [Candidatus Omnitrophica bacterium]|nr:Flp pilus assembly complex ATPase component TadA [Candidatus Omnitrophota bacterium]